MTQNNPADPQKSSVPNQSLTLAELQQLSAAIKTWGQALGFQQLGVSDIDLTEAEAHLLRWLHAGYHGEMEYMARHGTRRSRPAELQSGTLRVISARMDYKPPATENAETVLQNPSLAYISRYALGARLP